MMKKVFAFIGAVILLVFICALVFLVSGAGSTDYYSQIDNSKLEETDSDGGVIDFSGGLEYSYTLYCYNEEGKEKEITFGASRELREGAFLHLKVMPVRGVLEWKEVQYEELPAAVQEKYSVQ